VDSGHRDETGAFVCSSIGWRRCGEKLCCMASTAIFKRGSGGMGEAMEGEGVRRYATWRKQTGGVRPVKTCGGRPAPAQSRWARDRRQTGEAMPLAGGP
jgi:hypothetical protein